MTAPTNWPLDPDVLAFIDNLEIIVWLDHKSDGGWTRLRDVEPKCSVMVSVGVLVAENDEAVAHAPTLGGLHEAEEHRDAGDVMHTGKGMILARWKLTLEPPQDRLQAVTIGPYATSPTIVTTKTA